MNWLTSLFNHRKIAKELEKCEAQLLDMTALKEVRDSEIQILNDQNIRFQEQIKKINTVENERAQVIVAFDDDLIQGTPIIKHKGERTADKLVEIKYMSDTDVHSEHAIQLTMLVLARDFLEQLVSAYEEDLHD